MPGGGDWYTLLFCGKCRNGLMARFRKTTTNYNSPMQCPGDPTDNGNLLNDIRNRSPRARQIIYQRG